MPKQFYQLAPIEFDYALKDWQTEDRNKWERMRLVICNAINPSLKKPNPMPLEHRIIIKMMPFEWDERPEDIVFSQEYIDRIAERDKKVHKVLAERKNGK